MVILSVILLVFAFVLACLAARKFGAPAWELGWLAIAFYFLSLLIGSMGGLHLTR